MTEDDDKKLDEAIIGAWSDVKVDDRLKAATLKAVHEAALTAEKTTGEATEAPGAQEIAASEPATEVASESVTEVVSESVTEAVSEPAAEAASESCASKVVARIEPQANDGKSSEAGSSPIPSRHKSKVFRSRGFIVGLIAAVLCLAFVGIGGNAVYHTETAYASISAKASVTLGVNRFGNVISVSAGDPLLQDEIDALGLSGRAYADAISALVASGYLGSTEVDITVSADADAQENELVNTSTESLEEAGCSGMCNGNGYGHRYRGGRDAGSSSSEGSEQACADTSTDACSESESGTCTGEKCAGENSSSADSGSESCSGEDCDGEDCDGTCNGKGKGNGNGTGNQYGKANKES